jgi:hypothetical protein
MPANPLPRLLAMFAACALLSACAARPVQCQLPEPPRQLMERQPVDNLDRLRTFYKTLQPSQPSGQTGTQPN